MSFAFSYFICRFPPFFVCVSRIPFRKRRYNHCFGYNCYCDFAPSKGHRWCLREDSMWDSNSRGTMPLGRRGSDSHQRLSFIAAPFESSFAKRKRTPMVSFSFWPALGDSNPQPSESESDTLSNCAKGRYEIPCGIYLFSESFIKFSAFL